MCQICVTRDTFVAQLESVHSFSPAHHEMMCEGLLQAVCASSIAHAGHRRAAESFFKHADRCIELAPVEPLALPPRKWWQPWAEMASRNLMSLVILGGFGVGLVAGLLVGGLQ